MDTYLKLLALVLSGCAAALLLRDSPFRFLSALCCVALCGILAAELLEPVLDLIDQMTDMAGISRAVFGPVLKAAAIGILSQMAGSFCRDAGEGALAGAVELGGALAILYVSLPLFSAVLDLLETLMEG